MRPRILLALFICSLFAACVSEDIKETGIPRYRAIDIAKNACKEYPDKYGYVDSAEWNSASHLWVVEITNYRATSGNRYKINKSGSVVKVEKFGDGSDNDRDYYDRPYRHSWYY
jgi:hypothetical protein